MLTYRDAGVDLNAADRFKSWLKDLLIEASTPQVRSRPGGFGALYKVEGFKSPLLVSSVDSVGTKLKVASWAGRHDTVGQDLVNHCINDILTMGATPLFFLDYIGYSLLDDEILEEIALGLAHACKEAGIALVGGETAQLPGVYPPGEYDLVGFILGAVEEGEVVDGSRIEPGDRLIGLPSSGLHTNGYSLVRKVLLEEGGFKPDSVLPELGRPLAEELLSVHRSYLKPLKPVLQRVHGLAHITGGGFSGNLPRVLPQGLGCVVDRSSWAPPPIFKLIQRLGEIPAPEMYRVFNMGVGMVLFIPPNEVEGLLEGLGEGFILGEVVEGDFGVAFKG